MTRRGALIGAMMMTVGKIALAEQNRSEVMIERTIFEPSLLSFDFTAPSFKALVLKFPGKTLTFTHEELQREFETSPPCVHEAELWASKPTPFVVDVAHPERALDVCHKCGVTFWRAR